MSGNSLYEGKTPRVISVEEKQPDEIGDLVVYLASKAARGMTGQAISHCGGQVMW